MTPWKQIYDPLGSWVLSTLISALPVLTLFFVLVVLKKRVWVSAMWGMVMAVVLAISVFGMPSPLVAAAATHGVIFGLLRIAWIIVTSMFLYNVAVETGQFQVMKDSIASLSSDKRLQLILIAFCFGAFLEGTGGGGAPVAIAGSFLIGLGFPPFQAATLCLIANTAPVAWGGVGNPLRTLAGVTDLNEHTLSVMTGRILPPLSAILPLWLVRSMVGWKETREVWPALVVSGLSFAGMQFYWSNYRDNSLVDIVSALFSLLVMVGFLKFWKPKNVLSVRAPSGAGPSLAALPNHSRSAILKGWSPFLLASVFIFIAGYPAINQHLIFPSLRQPMPGLHNAVLRVPPVAPVISPEAAIVDLNFIALPGTAIFAGTVLAALWLGLSLPKTMGILARTFKELAGSLLAISFMVGLAFITRYSGMDTVMGLSLTRTGWLYPFFGTLLGWLGVALTGTDAGSNALFGNLQKVTAEQLGLSPILMASANSAGGVMGKMIDAQSIVVSSAATQQAGNEANIFKAVFKHSIILASMVGIIVMLYAFVFQALYRNETVAIREIGKFTRPGGCLTGGQFPTPSTSGPGDYGFVLVRPGRRNFRMFTPILSAAVQDTFLAQAGAAVSVITAILAGVVCLLVWQLWQARDSYAEDLAEQVHQLQEEQEKARRALEEKEALAKDGLAKSEMLATLSREIRAHLNGVIGSADLLMDNSLKPRQRELLITLRSSAEALHQSLNDVLEYSSIETGAIDLERAPFDLRQPLIDLVETLSPQALVKGLELVLIIAPDVPLQAEGDAVRVRQLLHNMMANSVKFTPNGRVVLRVELPKGSAAPSSKGANWLHFSISDTGPVLTDEQLETIFERFGQSDAPSPRKFGGSGLELAISKKLVELMGGKIGARALPENGIEFWAVLPVSDSKAGNPPLPEVPGGFHVVILDDLAAARVAASAMLSRLGIDHDVTDTEAKAEGLLRDALETNASQPAIMVDESVIKDSAEELARMVAEGSPLQATRIIVMSADPESLRPVTLAFPVAAVVRKPLLRAELLIEALNKTPGSVWMSRSPFDLVTEPPFRDGPLVLVVDDDEISRSVSSQLLARLGCRVELAASGAEAISRAGSTTFELVFMDCHMPDMDGFTATRKIRADAGSQTPPIVALTANTAVGDREKCFAAGMCDFVAKPARKAELSRVLKAWTDLGRTPAK